MALHVVLLSVLGA